MAAENEGVKLLRVWSSPFSQRVEIALKLKGVEYKSFEEDLLNKSDLLLKYNPIHKKIPVLVHNEKPLAESLIIMEYIDETWKDNPILPKDPYERAIARFWVNFIDDKFSAAIRKACLTKEEQEREKGVEEAKEALGILENELKDKKFFGGENFGFVDIAAMVVGYWLGVIQEAAGLEIFTCENFPKLYKWSEEIVRCPVIKETLPARDKLVAFVKVRLQAINN